HELVMTIFIPGGWIATNIATACASLVGVYVFALIVRHVGLPNRGLLVVGFAFAPLLVINSIATMDYMWTLTALLLSYYLALKQRPVLSGIAMGCAVGFRLQSVLLWPAIVYLLWREGRKREIPAMSLAAGGAAMLCYAPVLVVYGLHFLNYYDASVAWQDVLRLLGKEALGVVGALGLLIGLFLSRHRLRQLPHDLRHDVQAGVWVLVIVLYFISFSRLPHEIAYLIPVFPFGMLLMGRYFTRTALAISIIAILFAGAFDLTTPGDQLTLASLKTARPGWGLLISNAETMQGQHEFIDHIMANDLPDHSVVLAGFIYPQLAVRERDKLHSQILQRDYGAISMLTDRGESVDNAHDVRYVWLVTYDTFQALVSQGYSFYLVPDAVGSTPALYKYRPNLFGATFLYLDRSGPSTSNASAGTNR
ncbi:MAG TPA: hypothetical protein VFY10_00880, partial [Dehalococcoidia bacterium]|nr:hypothetical protein [Dehalococcoidia bacterium]